MITLVDGRLFDKERIFDQLEDARRLRAIAVLSAPLAGAVMGGALYLDLPWPAMTLMILSGIIGNVTAFLAHRQSNQNVNRLRVDFNISYHLCRDYLAVNWRDGLLDDVAHWARLNGVSMQAYVESNEDDEPQRIHFSFQDYDDKVLFRMKWI